jgi:RNA 2',3'-cyclic 3'-phosphodiesterase
MTRTHGTARLFVAIDPPQDVCEQLAAWARVAVRGLGLRRGASSPVRVLDPELLHLTVCFLGSRPVEEIGAIGSALAECATLVGELQIGAPVWLPPRRPRALAVEVRDGDGGVGGGEAPVESLGALHDGLVDTLARVCDYRGERRRFRAHITLARTRDDRGRRHLTERALPPTPPLVFTPESLVLYRSWLSPAGASYEALAKRTLVPA